MVDDSVTNTLFQNSPSKPKMNGVHLVPKRSVANLSEKIFNVGSKVHFFPRTQKKGKGKKARATTSKKVAKRRKKGVVLQPTETAGDFGNVYSGNSKNKGFRVPKKRKRTGG